MSTTCRSCGGEGLESVLDLGSSPIANNLLRTGDPALSNPGLEPRFPLEVAFCAGCSLVQLVDALPAEVIFSSSYPYYSSFSPMLVAHAGQHARGLVAARDLGSGSFVVEVASNDGYLLRAFDEHDVPVLGVDPSPGPAAAAREAGVPTLTDFFGLSLAQKIRAEHGPADVLIANNVLAHVPDLDDFVAGLAELVAPDGLITIENPYVRELVDQCEFDTIYHEHYCYYSCTSVARLVERHGLHLNDAEFFPDLHGGTLRWHVETVPRRSRRLEDLLRTEREDGVTDASYYRGFAERVQQSRADLLELVHGLRDEGHRIAAYGAAAKGSTLANYVGLTTDLVDYVVDRNPHKQGMLMPGTHQPIRPVEALVQDKPDYVLLYAWNFAEEIMTLQAEYLGRGGRFIRPVPTPEVLS